VSSSQQIFPRRFSTDLQLRLIIITSSNQVYNHRLVLSMLVTFLPCKSDQPRFRHQRLQFLLVGMSPRIMVVVQSKAILSTLTMERTGTSLKLTLSTTRSPGLTQV
jgi:hypothetical protein